MGKHSQFPPMLRKRFQRAMPADENGLRSLIGRLKAGELWLAPVIERALRRDGLFSDATASVIDGWTRLGMRRVEESLGRIARLMKRPSDEFTEAECANYVFEACRKQFKAFALNETLFLLQERLIPAEVVRRLARADIGSVPLESRVHAEVLRKLDRYSDLLDSETRTHLAGLRRELLDDEPDKDGFEEA